MVTRNANDIAVLKFSDGDEFSCKELQLYPACLPSKGEDYEGWTKVIPMGSPADRPGAGHGDRLGQDGRGRTRLHHPDEGAAAHQGGRGVQHSSRRRRR